MIKHSTILGFSRLDITGLSNERIDVSALICPVIDNQRRIDLTHRVNLNINNLGFLSSRMQIRNGVLIGRRIMNQHKLRINLPENYRPDILSLKELPLDTSAYPELFEKKFPDFFDMPFVVTKGISLETGQSVKIAISCAELLRFYYPHTALVEAAFSGNSASKVLYNPDVLLHKNYRPFVQLRKKIPDICAPFVARVRHSRHAEDVFDRIFTDSIYSVPLNSSKERHLKVYPPVAGTMDWNAEVAQVAPNFYIINSLLQCGGDFPFTDLLFGRDNDGRTVKGRPTPKKINYIPRFTPRLEHNEGSDEQVKKLITSLTRGYEAQIETLTVEFDFEGDTPQHNMLKNKSLKKIEKVSLQDPETMNVQVFSGEVAIKGIAGAGFINNENRERFAKAEISTGTIRKSNVDNEKRSVSFQDGFDVFQDAANELSSIYNLNWRKASEWNLPTKSSFYLNAFLPAEVSDREFLILSKKGFSSKDHDKKFLNSRKFVIAELSFEGRYIYLVDFEKRLIKKRNEDLYRYENTSVLLFFSSDGKVLSDDQIKLTILDFADSRSSWADKRTKFRLNHENDAVQFADKLERKAGSAFRKLEYETTLANEKQSARSQTCIET
ncbi:hypothetical protein [Pseudoalteromonas sp. OOF1S-7]|uniref:hypothetical protein n=1 Tax=Pseudoalteromonas sp. OOF1S-7 TaxID=2917757 RepID=UPI001EF491A5|nr:hypothetical protein [Pseudoalteromonas sp. OOF1S-7]MCG7535807.1 hypothetical protein [Pseudoalteromonas sp. OOF1S-7]